MLFNNEKIIKICSSRNITPTQLFYMYAAYTGDWKVVYEFIKVKRIIGDKIVHGFDVKHELEPLVESGYLILWDNGKPASEKWNFQYNPVKNINEFRDNLEVTPKFKKMLLIDAEQAGEELFKIYPSYINVDGNKVNAKQGAEYKGRYLGKEDLIEMYVKKLNHDYEQHELNLRGIEKAKAHGIQFPVIRKYIIDELWDSFNELEEFEVVNKTTTI